MGIVDIGLESQNMQLRLGIRVITIRNMGAKENALC